MKKIAIITGGRWSERAVSLHSAESVRNGLDPTLYEISTYDFPEDFQCFLLDPKPDFAFVMVHGTDWEDGKIPAMLDLLGIPSQGADFATHALCMDKIRTKAIWKNAGIPLAKDIVLAPQGYDLEGFSRKITQEIGFPVVLKVPNEWSSNGVYILHSFSELQEIWPQLSTYSGYFLIEEYVVGREITVSILDLPDGSTQVLPIIEIILPVGKMFDYTNKYSGETRELCPANIPEAYAQEIWEMSRRAYRALWVSGYGRIDILLPDAGGMRFLELNTIPWFTNQSLFPLAAHTAGFSFSELLDVLMIVGTRNFLART